MKHIVLVFVMLLSIGLSPNLVCAADSYVLPYPSLLPGNKFYSISQLWESAERFWYFGDFGQITFTLKLADKYLVEAKTLFEYEQYLLGYNALQKSNLYFSQLPTLLSSAQLHGKRIAEFDSKIKNAAKKHNEELERIKQEIPEAFLWSPEYSPPQNLLLHKEIDRAITIRGKVF